MKPEDLRKQYPDACTQIRNEAYLEAAEHSKPSAATLELINGLRKDINSIRESISAHTQKVCERTQAETKRDAFIDRLMEEQMEETIAWNFFKKRATKTNSWIHTIADFSKTLGTLAVMIYAIYHFVISHFVLK